PVYSLTLPSFPTRRSSDLDPALERVTDSTGRLDQLPWERVAQARIGGREPVVLLEDLLAAWPDVRFNLDIKAAGIIAPLARTVRSEEHTSELQSREKLVCR